MKKNIITFLVFFGIFLIMTSLSIVDLDEIWCYGFSYNIASGLVPYKDFNMVIGPLYSMLLSIPLLFGNYLYLFEIGHCIIYGIVFTMIYKQINKKAIFLAFLLGAALTVCGYNIFVSVLMLAILVLLDSDFKYKDIVIGMIIGMIIMTKQNIGGCLAILYLFTSKNKLKSIISILISVIPIITYLVINNAFYQYIDFCYLGLGGFLDNFVLELVSLIPWLIFIYLLIKKYKETKDLKIIYIFVFQIIVFPIIDQGHVVPAIIPIVYYLLLTNKNKRIDLYIKMFTTIGFIMAAIVMPIIKYEFNTKNNYLKFQMLPKKMNSYLENYSKYIDKLDDGEIYLFVDNAYVIRIYKDENPSFYDLINNGNLGSNTNKYIEMMDKNCKDKKCYFILDYYFFNREKYKYNQRPTSFKDYVLENANYLETIPSGDRIYVNK